MAKPTIPDLKLHIDIARSGVLYFWVLAGVVFLAGLGIVGLAFRVHLHVANLDENVIKLGGLFISLLSAYPIKEVLARRDRLRVLRGLQNLIQQLLSSNDAPEEDLRRVSDLAWEVWKKGAVGS